MLVVSGILSAPLLQQYEVPHSSFPVFLYAHPVSIIVCASCLPHHTFTVLHSCLEVENVWIFLQGQTFILISYYSMGLICVLKKAALMLACVQMFTICFCFFRLCMIIVISLNFGVLKYVDWSRQAVVIVLACTSHMILKVLLSDWSCTHFCSHLKSLISYIY